MKSLKKLLAMFLSIIIVIGIVPYQLFAFAANKGKPTVLNTEKGRIDVEPDWDTEFPYGTFAIEQSEAALEEGGETLTVNVYRLGGTSGRATALVRYSPALVPIGEDSYGYSTAVSTDDIKIEVEQALPIAQYQPVGKDPDPEESGVGISKKESGDDIILSLSVKADGYQWQSSAGDKWKDVSGASGKTFTAAKEDADNFDFRCVYTQKGIKYCTDSLKGEKYEKPQEKPLPEMPDDIDLNPDKSFAELEPDKKIRISDTIFTLPSLTANG